MALLAVLVAAPLLLLALRTDRSLAAPADAAPVARKPGATTVDPTPPAAASSTFTPAGFRATAPTAQVSAPAIAWHKSRAIGLPYSGRLIAGVQLPVEGPGWVTWDPVRDRVPNRVNRLYGTDTLVRLVLRVIGEYHTAHPSAPPVVIGDLSHPRGGDIDEHVSHENGLDVDVYYPRLDRRALSPTAVDQIDLRLAQDLLDRFLAAGVQVVFVGQHVDLHGPSDRVVPYPEHDNHMHVRLAPHSGSGE
jgi:murein endopeptidase